MRTTDHRYVRDRQKIELALRFIRLEARTGTIRLWTGLTADRIRKLYRTHFHDVPGAFVPRHRGKPPRLAAFFTRTARVQRESSSLGALCTLLEALPIEGRHDLQPPVPLLERGHRLCNAYETFMRFLPKPAITFEHAVHFVTAIVRGEELRLATCVDCAGLFVADRLALRIDRCNACPAAASREHSTRLVTHAPVP